MPTPVFATSFEHGVVITGATPAPNDRIWHTVVTTGGTPIMNTTDARSGARCLEIPATSGAASYVGRIVVGAPTIQVKSFYVRFKGSVPTADCLLFAFTTAAGSFGMLLFKASDSKLYASFGAAIIGATGFTVAADTWYLVDIRVNVGTDPRTCDVTVNGTALGSASLAALASTISTFTIGKNVVATTANVNVLYDDLVLSATTGDYPMGEHEVLVMRPNADGTHSFTANDFIRGDAGAAILVSDTDVWTLLDDTILDPPIGTTDSVQQNVIRSTGYVEVGFEASPRPGVDAWGIQVSGSYDADATGASTVTLKLNDGGTLADLYALADVSNTTVTFLTHHRATAPSGGAWTQAKLDALLARWGFSTDVTGSPIIHGLMIEAAFPIAGAPSTQAPRSMHQYRMRRAA